MKKLMIAAAAAATVGGAFAAPQVYDMTITVKATECKSANKAYKNVCADDVSSIAPRPPRSSTASSGVATAT